MSTGASYRQILRSTFVSGGASLANILLGILRLKVAAVVLGPSGVGLIGLFHQFMVTASLIIGMGVANAGTRQIALISIHGNADDTATIRRAIVWISMALSFFGGSLLWIFRKPIAGWALNDPDGGYIVAWLALGVSFSVAAGSQLAQLNGFRRINDLAQISVYSAVLSTLVGVPAIVFLGENGIIFMIVAIPMTNFLMGYFYTFRLSKFGGPLLEFKELAAQGKILIRFGGAIMIAGLFLLISQLVVRVIVQRDIGSNELGQFSAAWAISATYIGFVLGAMAADYYPRLTAVIFDKESANKVVNEQMEMALLLAGPVLIAMMAFAPWVVRVLYSEEFSPAVGVLRWQVLGDVLKVASWPLGFVLLASASGKFYVIAESIAAAIFLGFTWLAIPFFGVDSTGVAFFVMYLIYFPLVYWLTWVRVGFVCSPVNFIISVFLMSSLIFLFILSRWSQLLGAAVGLFLVMVLSVLAFYRLRNRMGGAKFEDVL